MSDIYRLYTDGSCRGTPGKGAWAAIIVDSDGNEKSLYGASSCTTNNRMELRAIIKGIAAIPKGSKIEIISDSKYCLDGIQKALAGTNKYKINVDMWEEIYALIQDRLFKLHWVRGHDGHEMNERLNEMAQATSLDAKESDPIDLETK